VATEIYIKQAIEHLGGFINEQETIIESIKKSQNIGMSSKRT